MSANPIHAGVVMISLDCLRECLGLTEAHRITHVLPMEASDILHRNVRVVLEGPGMPLAFEGCALQVIPLSVERS